jgi:hypothetical protein
MRFKEVSVGTSKFCREFTCLKGHKCSRKTKDEKHCPYISPIDTRNPFPKREDGDDRIHKEKRNRKVNNKWVDIHNGMSIDLWMVVCNTIEKVSGK